MLTDSRLDRMTAGIRPYLLLFLFCFVVYLPGIGTLPPVDRDESRFAQATRQMLETGDYVTIRFQDEPRHKKPVGIHWLQAGAVQAAEAVGIGRATEIWIYRVPSLVGATAAVWLLFVAGQILFDRRTAFVASALLGISVILVLEAHAAKTDAVLLATVLLAQAVLARVYMGAQRGERAGLGLALLFWAAQGAGILVKGPIVPMISGLTVLALSLYDRDWSWLRGMRPFRGLAVVVVIVAPWFMAVQDATGGAFVADAVAEDLLPKLISGQESHGAPPGYYLLLMTLTFWPGSLLAWLGRWRGWKRRDSAAERFCLAWLIPAWLVFELVPTKLPHYVLPLYPALALLAARALFAAEQEGLPGLRSWWARAGPLAWCATGLLLAALVVALPIVVDRRFDLLALIPAAAAAAVAIYGYRAARRGRWRNAVAASLLGAAAFVVGTLGFVLPNVQGFWLSRGVAEAVSRLTPPLPDPEEGAFIAPQVLVAATGYSEPSLVFLLGTQTSLVAPEGAAALLGQDPNVLAVVSHRVDAAFREHLARYGVEPRELASVSGINYSKGQRLTLRIYGADPAEAQIGQR